MTLTPISVATTDDIATVTAEPEFSDKAGIALTSLILQMQTAGYKCGAPHPDIDKLDADIISKWVCLRCGGKLHYEPFYVPFPRSYRPFTVCTQCGQVKEF